MWVLPESAVVVERVRCSQSRAMPGDAIVSGGGQFREVTYIP
jgi:hypothetical protein